MNQGREGSGTRKINGVGSVDVDGSATRRFAEAAAVSTIWRLFARIHWDIVANLL
jgi:hypothetical protein